MQNDLIKKLSELGESDLLKDYDKLTKEQKDLFREKIFSIDAKLFHEQKSLINERNDSQINFEPFSDYDLAGSKSDQELGLRNLQSGHLGCIIIAGGQATRLKESGGCKGLFPVTCIKHKSFFQLFAEKTLAAGKQVGRKLFIAIMASPSNIEETKNYFEENAFFGLDRSQVDFFVQENLPLLNEEGHLFFDQEGHISEGPNGNGLALYYFYKSSIFEKWKKNNILYVHSIQVDNALADPFDQELLGYHVRKNNDITLKCVARKDPKEKVGVLVKEGGHCRVIEYSEFPEAAWIKQKPDGSLLHLCANISLFCFSMDFIEKNAQFFKDVMPLHSAKKAHAWKFEKFIFDILPFAKKVSALLFPRELVFAPLKNSSGPDSIIEVQKALQSADIRAFVKISGTPLTERHFELAQEFHYPTVELLKKWRGKNLPEDHSYIES